MEDAIWKNERTVEARNRLIRIHHCKSAGWSLLFSFLKADPSLKILERFSPAELSSRFHLPIEKARHLHAEYHAVEIEELLTDFSKRGIQVRTVFDPDYPNLLKQIFRPPFVLYFRGDLSVLEMPVLSIVGSRNPTEYGRSVVRKLVPPLIEEGFAICSGLARGIDREAHVQTMRAGGKTVAVLPGGFEQVYPPELGDLAEQIAARHLLLTEYPPHFPPKRPQFPERNRIIAGLSWGTIVVEAARKSGSLITARFALEAGREVFAVPGPITHPNSHGTNRLIQEGAKLVLDSGDISEELFPVLREKYRKPEASIDKTGKYL